MNRRTKRLRIGGLVAGSIMAGTAALVVGAGIAKAEPIDPAQICGVYYHSSALLAEEYGISRREATIQAVEGWYHISHSRAEAAFDAAGC
jgi:hypothetical protein